MPLYEVEHYIPLSDQQKERLAQAITHIHSRLFTTPSLFVNVRFLSKSQSQDHNYVGGKRRNLNRILAHTRPRPSTPPQTYTRLCDSITTSWNTILAFQSSLSPPPSHSFSPFLQSSSSKYPTELHGIFILSDIVAGTEAGFALPAAREDRMWLRANMEEFRERAKYGDGDFRDLLGEIERREDLRVDDCDGGQGQNGNGVGMAEGDGDADGPPAYKV